MSKRGHEDDILPAFEEERKKLFMPASASTLTSFEQIILQILTGEHNRAAAALSAESDFDVYALELALSNTAYSTFFNDQDIWNKRRIALFGDYESIFTLPDRYSPRWRFFVERTILASLNIYANHTFIKHNTGQKVVILLQYDSKLKITEFNQPLTAFGLPIIINGTTTWSKKFTSDAKRTDIAGQIMYNLFATGYMLQINTGNGKLYEINQCLTCNQKTTMCETGDTSRVFCGESCQTNYYYSTTKNLEFILYK